MQIGLFSALEWVPQRAGVTADMVASVAVMGSPACVIFLAGEPWAAVIEVEGERRTMMWQTVDLHAAVSRLGAIARAAGLPVRPTRHQGAHLCVAGVPVAVSTGGGRALTQHLRRELPGVLVLSVEPGARTRKIRGELVAGIRSAKRARRDRQDASRWV